MKKNSYKNIYILKIILSFVFLSLFLYFSFAIHSRTTLDKQNILFAVDLSNESLDLSKLQMSGLLLMLDENYNVGLVSFAGLAEVEVPFVQNHFVLKKYIDSLIPEENFVGRDINNLNALLDELNTDRVIMFPLPIGIDLEEFSYSLHDEGFHFIKFGDIIIGFLLMILLILIL